MCLPIWLHDALARLDRREWFQYAIIPYFYYHFLCIFVVVVVAVVLFSLRSLHYSVFGLVQTQRAQYEHEHKHERAEGNMDIMFVHNYRGWGKATMVFYLNMKMMWTKNSRESLDSVSISRRISFHITHNSAFCFASWWRKCCEKHEKLYRKVHYLFV